MQVRGFAIEFIKALSKIEEMLSCPELFLGFRFLMMFFFFLLNWSKFKYSFEFVNV